MGNYRTDDECRYYASDLNKFARERCTRKMTVMNIDLVMYKYGIGKVRFIESKHVRESDNRHQDILYKIIADESDFEFYKITGDPPYIVAVIYNYKTDDSVRVTQEQLVSFLDFEVSFNDLKSLLTN